MLNFYSPEITLKMVQEQTERATKQAYWLHQLADYAPSADTASEASAVVHKRNLVARIVERIAGSERDDEANA